MKSFYLSFFLTLFAKQLRGRCTASRQLNHARQPNHERNPGRNNNLPVNIASNLRYRRQIFV